MHAVTLQLKFDRIHVRIIPSVAHDVNAVALIKFVPTRA